MSGMAFDEENQARIAARTRNIVHSILLIGGIVAIMTFSAYLLFGRGGIVWVFVLIGILLLLSPRIAPELIMRMYGARRIGLGDGAPVLRIVDQLAQRAELPAPPALYVIPTPMINAFATGTRSNAILAVTHGLLNKLNGRELIGVLAHEMAHVRHNDLWIMNLADTMSRFTHLMSLTGIVLFFVSLPMALMGAETIPWLGIVLLYFAPTGSALLQLGLSRAREYDADLEGARLSGDPEGLASALHKIETYQGRIWETVFMPGRSLPVPSLLRTHPPTEERIRRLLDLRKPAREPLQTPGIEAVAPRFVPARLRPSYHFNGLWY
ncbi:MAG: M48 family metalloprotease [Rhodomicrobium sp.]|nr:M48 family metalloprotease [Rhodomicrobium sp.]